MLTVSFLQVARKGKDLANYEVKVRVNSEVIYTGHVINHDRKLGWLFLVFQFVYQVFLDRERAKQ